MRTIESGWLVTAGHPEAEWPHWEMHPKGEELIFLLSGSVELIVEDEGGEHVVPMRRGRST
jgi:hypothetical protein